MLSTLIQSIDAWQDKASDELAAILNAATVEVRDDQLYTWSGVALIIGPQGAEQLRLLLESNGAGWAVHQLGGSGIQLSHPLTQGMLAAFSGALPACADLALVGIRSVSPFVADGGSGEVTAQEVADELAVLSLAATKRQMEDAAVDALQVFRERLSAWDGSGDAPVLGAV